MNKPESAVYDGKREQIYISNINGEYLAKDGNGFISAIRPDGTVAAARWFDGGLDNPQGLALVGDLLYVADIDRIVVIDVLMRKIVVTHGVPGAKFLNDLAADANGDVYISDCFANKLYRLRAGQVELWLEAPELNKPNGLFCEPDGLVVANMGDGVCYRVERTSKKLTILCNGIANADGIASDGAGGYLVTGAWQGHVYRASRGGEKSLLLDLGPERLAAADLVFIPELKLVVVPTLGVAARGYRWPPKRDRP